jgi:zinc protease
VTAVQRYQLDNGLTVLLKEVHSAPVISWWVLYRVGSRNERTGQTGVSHWVEHMMFKGTERFPAGVLDRGIDRLGGLWNAQTSMDYTAYYETMPADRIDLALELEADRMANAQFLEADVDRSAPSSSLSGRARRIRRCSGWAKRSAERPSACMATTTRSSAIWSICRP